jgi:hypothetical protein
MSAGSDEYPFLTALGRTIASGSSRAVVLTGNVQDLFRLEGDGSAAYVPLLNLLSKRLDVDRYVPVVWELNQPVRFLGEADRKRFTEAWVQFQTGLAAGDAKIERFLNPGTKTQHGRWAEEFNDQLEEAAGRPGLALEILRAMCECARAVIKGEPVFVDEEGRRLHLIVIIEDANFLIPEGRMDVMSDANLQRIAICRDWFSDLGFLEGGDTVVLITESRSLLHEQVAKLPQFTEVVIPSPSEPERLAFIQWFNGRQPGDRRVQSWASEEELAKYTAGLTVHALRQLLVAASHARRTLTLRDVTGQVERFIRDQLGGEDVVEFKQPEHSFADIVGFRDAKAFIEQLVIPGLRLTTKDALSSIVICGAIGVGKTFLWEAVAARLGVPVLVLKNLRSKWFGETDVIFERLRRTLEALSKVIIYVNEADTAFGGVGVDVHETERRLTGKLQAMMADPRLRGRVHWLLDSARVHLLPEDLRRPGRGGDLIFAMFDPEDEDRADFIRWTVESVLEGPVDPATFEAVDVATKGYYASAFSSLRAELRRQANGLGRRLAADEVLALVRDITPADIGLTRRSQTLQALLNCTRKSLRPARYRTLEGAAWEAQVAEWYQEAAKLEAAGVH